MELRKLFPEIEPFDTGYYEADGHKVYYEQVGSPNGIPVVQIHGGPGGGGNKDLRRFFDPEFYRVIIIDQRGSGRSTPFLKLEDNNTEKLIEDMEAIREKLKIDKWLVSGGSWGTTLGLYYAENYTERVMGLILRGIFLGRQEDVDWLYQEGAGYFFPEVYDKYTELLTEEERKDNVGSYYKYLKSDDIEVKRKYGKRFADYEASLVKLRPKMLSEEIEDHDLSIALLETHYSINKFFFEENYIMNNVHKIKDIQTIIVHGRYDLDCRPVGAYELSKNLNKCKLVFPISGHTSYDEEMTHELILAQEEFKKLF